MKPKPSNAPRFGKKYFGKRRNNFNMGLKSSAGPSADKRFLSKNKSLKIFKEKQKKREAFLKEVQQLTKRYDEIDSSTITKLSQFPLSERTQKGLLRCKYYEPTEIQRDLIGLALKGHDILGAAKTGSGKTLAFVIPVLECLFRHGWCHEDGLGALIITPIRELAYQIFEVFNNVGAFHDFSVALIIGGKLERHNVEKEKKVLDRFNIIICTPGRLLQHMNENPLMDATYLKILVLDEADRILDATFKETINNILENIPQERQVLLFSATQTKSVTALARLCLKNPIYLSIHELARYSTPKDLTQYYIVCEAHNKMNLLFSFLKKHLKEKILIFMASCKQVKYTFEVFCRMRPGITLSALHGNLPQHRRINIYQDFKRKEIIAMIATDVAARGLDFPNVNWVVQLDCPEDVDTYIHRAGRTARYKKEGKSLLVLLPSEEKSMIKQLKSRKIPIKKIKQESMKFLSVQKKMEFWCARVASLKDSAQRAFKAYFKNIFLMKDKSVFDVTKIDPKLYSESLGLASAPKIRFIAKRMKNKTSVIVENIDEVKREKPSLEIVTSSLEGAFNSHINDDSDDDLLIPKKASNDSTNSLAEKEKMPSESGEASDDDSKSNCKKPLTKAAVAKKILRKKIKPNKKVVFNEDGEAIEEFPKEKKSVLAAEIEKEMSGGYDIEKAKMIMAKEDEIDKNIYHLKIKQKHRDRRRKLKEQRRKEQKRDAAQLENDQSDEDASSEEEEIDPNQLARLESENENSENYLHQSYKRTAESADDSNKIILKRKSEKKIKKQNKKLKLEIYEDNGYNINTGPSLEDQENLALHFLSNS